MQIDKIKKNILLYKNNNFARISIPTQTLTQIPSTLTPIPSTPSSTPSSTQLSTFKNPNFNKNLNNKVLKYNKIVNSIIIEHNNNSIKIEHNNNSIKIEHNNNSIKKINEEYFSKYEEFNKFYKNHKNEILNNPKIGFRYLCYKYIDDIRKLQLPDIKLNNNYEAVLIEYRCMPHLEFLIRNMIHKLGKEWSHTVVCGTLNYNFMINMCNKIDKNIKIIKTKFDNLMPPYQYSQFLATEEFWKMFVGDKILLYQEDSIIFKSNINDFIEYDYVGAPWRKKCGLNMYDVGNGGFSLRTKQIMIDVIKKYPYNKQNKLFEDVYFTKNMINNNIGKIARWDVASNFSSELIYNPESLGGHAFWLSNKNWKEHVYDKIINKL